MPFDFENPRLKLAKEIFSEIDKVMEETKSKVPVTMEESEFLKKYLELKEIYTNEKLY